MVPSLILFFYPHDMLASACLPYTGYAIHAKYLQQKGRSSSLLQDLYAHSERVSASCPITEAALIRSEVTCVNHSTTAWKGHLRITIDHCRPLTSHSKGSKPREQSWGSMNHGTKRADHKADRQTQRIFTAAEHITAEQSQESNNQRRQQPRVEAKAQHSAPGKHGLSWTEPVSVPPGWTRLDMRDCILQSPQLWWPLNMGEQVCLAICALCNLSILVLFVSQLLHVSSAVNIREVDSNAVVWCIVWLKAQACSGDCRTCTVYG